MNPLSTQTIIIRDVMGVPRTFDESTLFTALAAKGFKVMGVDVASIVAAQQQTDESFINPVHDSPEQP